jgi:hypothetical protein
MDKTKLEMDFLDTANKVARISLDDPKTDLLPSEIQDAMESVITQNVFASKEGDFIAVSGARVITTNINELDFE